MAFKTAWSISENQQGNYQGSIIWFCRKTILRKKIPRSLYWQSSTFKNLSPPIIKTIQRSQ